MEEACGNGDLTAAKKCYAALFTVNGDDTTTPLMLPGGAGVLRRSFMVAAQNGQLATFSFLLERGARITGPIISAICDSGRLGLCEFLLERGWDVNEPVDGITPLS
jgi:hypothetical protein